jgi:hypothetical protein
MTGMKKKEQTEKKANRKMQAADEVTIISYNIAVLIFTHFKPCIYSKAFVRS